MKKGETTVAVAMSGGVDSACVAYLMLEAGYEVIGVTMINDPYQEPGFVDDARAVCEKIGIQHHIINLTVPFDQRVIQPFCDAYLAGRTPNPCVVCNREIKFGLLLDAALGLGADKLATGHYVRLEYDERRGRHLLRKGADTRKDQSYVLYALRQDQLARALFPLGGYTKTDIRALSQKIGLVVADKPDSQEICFVPDDYRRFLTERCGVQAAPGSFLNQAHQTIGRHQGISNYTVGQRKGLGLAMGHPVYVTAIDAPSNSVMIGEEKELWKRALRAGDCSFIPFDQLREPISVLAKIRYGAQPARAMVTPREGGTALVVFDSLQRAITPGQSVVFYDDADYMIGGGVIEKVVEESDYQE